MELKHTDIESLRNIIASEIVDTSEARKILSCSRQYIYQLISEGKLTPVYVCTGTKIFLKRDIISLKNKTMNI